MLISAARLKREPSPRNGLKTWLSIEIFPERFFYLLTWAVILIGNDTLNDPALLIDTGLAFTDSGALTRVQRLLPKSHLNTSDHEFIVFDWFELSTRQWSVQSCKP